MRLQSWLLIVGVIITVGVSACGDEVSVTHKGGKGGFDFFPPLGDQDEDIADETTQTDAQELDTDKQELLVEQLEDQIEPDSITEQEPDSYEQVDESVEPDSDLQELELPDVDPNDLDDDDQDIQDPDSPDLVDRDRDRDRDYDRDPDLIDRDRDRDREREFDDTADLPDLDPEIDSADTADTADLDEIDNVDAFDPDPDPDPEPVACQIEGALRCENNNAMRCENGQWRLYRECSPGVCRDGYCGPSPGPCPEGQSCVEISQSGLRACLIVDPSGQPRVPPGNQTGCNQNNPCQGNFNCYCLDQNCSQTVCLENCGICPGYLDCVPITQTMLLGCVETINGQPQLPEDAMHGCNSQNPCPGNFNCYCLDQSCSDTACIGNCSDNYPAPDGDTDTEIDLEPDPEPDQVTSCTTDEECPPGTICSADLVCVPDCTVTGCDVDEGQCNPRTGHCEWCDPPCDPGESCNYSPFGWYCGAPCTPPCPEGYACSRRGQCVPLRCPPRCPPGYYCSGSTGYVCQPIETEPELPFSPAPPTGNTCLPPTAPCIEGISDCCSGACVMGHCL